MRWFTRILVTLSVSRYLLFCTMFIYADFNISIGLNYLLMIER